MTRKEFLKWGAGALALIPGLAFLSGCKSSSSTTPPTTDSKMFTSSSSQSHTHTVTLAKTEIESPAALNKPTSTSGSHTHTVALTLDQVTSIKNGTPVTIETSTTDGHSHSFTIAKWY